MKKSFVFLFSLVILSGHLIAQKSETSMPFPPTAVSKQLRVEFPDITNEIWKKDQGNNYEASFTLNGLSVKALFDEFGNELQLETVLPISQLHLNASQYIAANYPGYSILQLAKNESGGEILYFVKVNKDKPNSLRIVFDINGNYVKTLFE